MGIFDFLGIHFPFTNNPQPGVGQYGTVPFNNPKSKPKTVIPAPSLGSSLGAYKNYPYSTGAPYGVTPSNSAQYQGALNKVQSALRASASSAIPRSDSFVDPYAAFDPERMAAREFDPQMALIAQQEAQAKSNYGAGAKDIGLGWDLIAKAIGGREAGIKSDTAARGKAITSGWGGVSSAADKSIDAARAEIIANAQRSGSSMESIAPLLAKLATSRAELESTTGARGQNWAGFNAQMGANAVQQNQLAQDTAKWGGINAKADFATRLQGALQELGNKRLETQAARGAAVNKYGLDITGARVSAKNAWEQLQTARAQQAIEMSNADAQAAAAAAKGSTPKDIDTTKLTPSEYLAYLAKIQYPNVGLDTQQRAIQAIQDTFTHPPKGGYKSAADFIAQLRARNPKAITSAGGDIRQLAQIAQDYYTKIAGGANKAYGGVGY